MKKLIFFTVFLINICILFLLSGCNVDFDINKLYTITCNEDFTYDYVIKDKNNNILISDKGVLREPKVNIINDSLLSISVQTGTGISTRWTVYCDVNNGSVSDTYYSVLCEFAENVVFVDYDNNTHNVVIQNIFNKEQYNKSIVLKDVSNVADPVVSFEKINDEKAKIVYLTGEDCLETELTIDIVPLS